MDREFIDAVFDEDLEARHFKVVEDYTEDNEPRMKIQGVCQRADVPNLNDRMYPKKHLEKAVKKFEGRINNGRAFGEVDHPMFAAQLKDTSHLVNKVWWDEKNSSLLCCEVTVTNTPQGNTLKEIVRAGGRPGFSSRGYGDAVKQKIGRKEVEVIQDGFDLRSFDFVINPSVTPARIRKVMESAVQRYFDKEEIMIKTLEELRAAYPLLVKEAEDKILEDAAAATDAEAQENAKLKTQVGTLTTEKETLKTENDTLKTQLQEKDETIETQTTAIGGITKSLQDGSLLPKVEGKPNISTPNDSANTEAIDALETENKTLKDSLQTTQSQVATLTDEVSKSKVEAHIETVLTGNSHASALRAKLSDCKTVEEVDKKMEQEKTFIKSLEENFGKKLPSGKGDETLEGEALEEEEIKKVKAQAKRLAGTGARK